MSYYMKKEANRIAKTANLLCNFQNYMCVCVCVCPDYSACKSHPFGNIMFQSLTVSLDSCGCTLFLLIISKKDMAFGEKKYPKCVAGYLVPHISTPRRFMRDIINLRGSSCRVSDLINWNKSKDFVNNPQHKI